MFFSFPEDARWNDEQQAMEFGVEIGEYRGLVRVPRRVFHASYRSAQPPSGASKRITCNARGLSGLPSASCGGAS